LTRAIPRTSRPCRIFFGELRRTRYQGLWLWDRLEKPDRAESFSRALAYHGGGDRNGWSITKMLRIPGSINHKPQYRKPTVTIVDCNWSPQSDRPIILHKAPANSGTPALTLRPDKHTPAVIWKRYRAKLHPRTNALILNKKAYSFERDRSKCIFEIIAGLHRAGATPDEIGAVLWSNPYFLSKHGHNFDRLCTEINRIISKLEAVK
jgi:hypothetical protein